MTDLLLTDSGDLAISHSGDLEMADTKRDLLQSAFIRCMTDEGDFLLYRQLGATLSNLYGMPQSPGTGAYAERLVETALQREGRFAGVPFKVSAVPTGPQTIRIDITIIYGRRETIEFSIEQDLIPDDAGPTESGWPSKWPEVWTA